MKQKVVISCFCFVFVVGYLFASVSFARAGMVGNWTFDDKVNKGADTSGNGNHGTLIGPPAWVSGKKNMCLEFNGDGDLVTVPSLENKKFHSLSICAWINPSFTEYSGTILSKTRSFEFSKNENGQLVFVLWLNNGTQWVKTTTQTIQFNQWTCACVTYGSGSGGNGLCLYLNGQEVLSDSSQTSVPSVSNEPVRIGEDLDDYRSWDGKLDEVRLYDHVLTPEQVAAFCGCSCDDTDGDGVPDAWDQCPDTPAGKPTDAVGCAVPSGVVVIPLS
ncbi:MAG: hypothetical protein CSA22_05445 [Deltaproteobacteria bacterium]|nr:MAG: hypothetical protein CSA22_05445 [Deltaproteobacteria bacterium]